MQSSKGSQISSFRTFPLWILVKFKNSTNIRPLDFHLLWIPFKTLHTNYQSFLFNLGRTPIHLAHSFLPSTPSFLSCQPNWAEAQPSRPKPGRLLSPSVGAPPPRQVPMPPPYRAARCRHATAVAIPPPPQQTRGPRGTPTATAAAATAQPLSPAAFAAAAHHFRHRRTTPRHALPWAATDHQTTDDAQSGEDTRRRPSSFRADAELCRRRLLSIHRPPQPIKGRRGPLFFPHIRALSSSSLSLLPWPAVACHRPISSSVAPLPIPFHHRLCLTPVIQLFSYFPSPLATATSHHHSRPELSSCRRRSGHPTLYLCLPPPSPGARCSGTRLDAAIEAVQPPEHRRPVSLSLSLCCYSGRRNRKREGSRKKEEEKRKRRRNWQWALLL